MAEVIIIIIIKMVNVIIQMVSLPVLKLLTVIFVCFCVASEPDPLLLIHVSHTPHPTSTEFSLRNFINCGRL